jgi:hypothetical protein
MWTFTDPVRNEEWRVLVEMDAEGYPHVVFALDAIRLHPTEELSGVEDLTEERLRQLFLTSHGEIGYEHETWRVRWEEQENLETWTWFESASGEKRVVKAQVMFPFISGSELADALRGAVQNAGGPP